MRDDWVSKFLTKRNIVILFKLSFKAFQLRVNEKLNEILQFHFKMYKPSFKENISHDMHMNSL